MTATASPREIPFNYTSADDRQAISHLLGPEVWRKLEELRTRRVTGRSARLLMRFFGEILIHRRNAYLFQELVESGSRRRRFLANIEKDLGVVERNANGEGRVLDVLGECRRLLAAFRKEVEGTPELRRRIQRELGAIVGKEGVLFDPFTLVSHATDATDWRLHLPVAVVMPDDEAQVAPVLAGIARLGLKAIPRGAGTGLTGGAVPLRPGCVVVNTEKLNRIRGISERTFRLPDGREQPAQVMEAEAGVITERAMELATEHGLVFATDPTSAWACTIGGNVAENAGGKDCVQWGTCIDNLVSWRMAMPSGRRWTVRRTDHALRKILPEDTVTFEVADEDGAVVKTVGLRGADVRKKGLWKDITNKALGGVPGLQKEGTDGVITSAEFILYPEYEVKRTLCLEFFGPDFDEASRVILQLSRAFPFPNEGRGGAHRARALRRRVRPGHRLQGEGGAAGDAPGRPPHRRGGPLGPRGRPRRGENPGDPRGAPEHAALRGARRRRGEALLGRPEEARRHRPAHQRVQDERGHRPPARGAGGVRPLPRRHERGGGALRAGPAGGPGGGDPPRRGAAQGRSRVAGRQDPGRAGAVRPGPRRRRARRPEGPPLAGAAGGLPARRGPAGPRLPGAHPRHGPRRTRRCATGWWSSPPTCTPATATCT